MEIGRKSDFAGRRAVFSRYGKYGTPHAEGADETGHACEASGCMVETMPCVE
jgi:hypothetical protein